VALPGPLAPLAADPARSALFLDYDGTLAPIVADPEGARPLPGVPAVLDRLADRFGLVAVVSGRPVAYLVEHLAPGPGVHLAGLYGLERRLPGQAVTVDPEAEPFRAAVARVVARSRAWAPPGVEVEDKGLGVTVHWRGRPDLAAEAEAFARDQARAEGLVGQPGRFALELRPPVERDKGTVVAELAPGHRAAAAFGDDLGDLPAFAALGRLAGPDLAVARVAVVDAESPAEVAAAADLVVEGPAGALTLLEGLLARGAP
jgi:trehalose 6-phosphate phosphatase